MKTSHAIVELPAQEKVLDKITADAQHEIISISHSSAATDDGIKHFVLIVWNDKDTSDHWHVGGSTPGRTYGA